MKDFNKLVDVSKLCEIYDETFESHKWQNEIPFLRFKKDWQIRIVPPSGGAVVRFLVSRAGSKKYVSVFLDCYSILGIFNEPYWEVYPYEHDVFRCGMNDTTELLDVIERALGNKRFHFFNH